MRRRIFHVISVCICVLAQSLTSCIHQHSPELLAAQDELKTLREQQAALPQFAPDSYEYFVSHQNYPVHLNVYRNQELLSRVSKKSRVVICLKQQRGRLYVDDQVAADWPVSTGIPGRETPTGKYSILEKKESYASNRYGRMYNDKGRCTNSDADIFTQEVPEGGRFEGSPMPYWMRLTWDGIGMHIGKVAAGKRLSHGCIRTPREICRELYKMLSIGTKVHVNSELESEFPAREALAFCATQSSLDTRISDLQKKIQLLIQQEEANR